MRKKATGAGIMAACALLVIGLAFGPTASATVPGVNALVSVDSSGAQANAGSQYSAVSGDGRYVAFSSSANNLVSGDTNGTPDIFVRDTVSSTTARVSVSSAGAQANGGSGQPRISYDGRYVVFESAATNLVGSDANGKDDVFVHDRQMGTTTIASINSSSSQGDQISYFPDISADGRFVVFESPSTNLVSGVSGYGIGDQVYIKDMSTGALKALSVTSAGAGGNGNSSGAHISCDGNVVAFRSAASNLVSGDTNGNADVFVDVLGWSGSVLTNATLGGNAASGPDSISCNGNYVSINTGATNLASGVSTGTIQAYNRLTGSYTVASMDGSGNVATGGVEKSSISDDGRYVSFLASSSLVSADGNSSRDVYVRDLRSGTTQVVSINPSMGGAAVGFIDFPSISADGSYITYYALADSNATYGAPVSNDNNGYADIYISQTGF
ncbi:MAG TPA: hypothetical protein VLI54_03490 [Bacillota bacterium]|nr:hypothetical protein [Bacillota bacterium]